NLAPGKYTFRVKASNNDNVWNEEGALLRFEIKPPFWLSLPARILYFILLLLTGYSIINFLIRKNKIKHQHQLETYKSEQETLAFKSKIDFFTNIAHEIRTPVSLIKAPLEEIILSGDGNCNTKQNLTIIEKNSERLTTLINQILDFRKMDSAKYFLKLNRLDLNKQITELYDRFRKTIQSQGVVFELILPSAKETEIITDPDALIKIVGNFLTNAIKHTKDKITLQVKCNNDESYTISVTDNGKGIPNDQKAKIFDPFYQIQSSENKKGTGIGLYIAKQLSEILGGSILVHDNPNGGSTFEFTFKSHTIEKIDEANNIETDMELHEESINFDMHDKKHILIVEDNFDMLHFIENCLKNEYLPDIAENVAEAFRLMELKPFDLIIADIMMPDVDGIEFTQQLRNDLNSSHIPIILLSAKTDINTKIDGLNAGADVFIEKPFSTSYLKAQISSLLANRKTILEAFNRSPLTSYSILTTNKNDQDFLNRLNEEINKNISDSDFSIESLTDKLFISRSNLQRKLKAICGYTPGDYLKTYRLKKASQLLFENGLRVNEVAYEVGFSSASYFTKCFVRQFGILPKDFVKENSK
ncbi:MAG: ATP-binding protein, partial [Ignavibacteria bacterium]|nr:ATP-binding protein [Ignavibacteria bacterium]